MPRTVPSQITAATADGSKLTWLWLVELHLSSGAYYLSSGESVSFNGHSFQANRVKSVSGISGQYIDGQNKEFGNGSIVLNGLSDDGSTSLPFVSAEGITNLDGGKMVIHGFDAESGTGIANMWFGYIKGRTYDGSDHTASIEASYIWDAPTASVPSSTLQQEGFGLLDTNTVKESVIDDTTIPIVIGAGPFKIRPNIYYSKTIGNIFRVNGVISGTRQGLPFNVNDITAAGMKLFDVTPAVSVNFHNGLDTDVTPHNATVFPDLSPHNNIAYFSADFPIDASNKDKLDNIQVDDIRMSIANGRPVKATGLITQNAVLILQDVLTDPRFGFGIDSTDFDSLTSVINASGVLWQGRLELHDAVSISDWVQNICRQTAMFITFNNGKVQVGQKGTSETSVATFATTRSGQSGGKIVNDAVKATFQSSDELDNQANVKYRGVNRHQHEIVAYDDSAQTSTVATGGQVRKVNKQDYEFDLLFDKDQVAIAAAMLIREQQDANMVIEFTAPIAEGVYPCPGDLITVWSEDIPNNAGNNVFRVISQPFDTGGDIPRVDFKARVYKSDVYQYSTAGIGIDEIRSGSDVSSLGRPPDVTPVSVSVIDKVTNDTGGTLANIQAVWTYPVVDLAGDASAGTVHEYPIHSVGLYWRYADEDVNAWKLGTEVLYPVATADFPVDYIKGKFVEVMFVAFSLAHSHGTFGYVEDPTKTAALTANFTGITATVDDATKFNVGDYTRCEFEINKVKSKAGNVLTMEPGTGTRTVYFGSSVLSHPSTTQIAVAKQNYPTLQVSLTQPKFTFANVTSLVARQRPDGVRFKWPRVVSPNRNPYLLYWSTDADANTNPAKLGSANPTWYATDPLTPPASVNLEEVADHSFLLLYEDIGGTSINAYGRVAARNNKGNYSSQLSPLNNQSAGGGTTAPPTDPPGPVTIQENIPDVTPEGLKGKVTIRVYADSTQTKTFAQTGATDINLVFNIPGSKKDRPSFPIDDTSQLFIDCVCYFTLGSSITLVKAVERNAGGPKATTLSIAFFAGGATTSLTGITSLAITGFRTIDEKHSYMDWGFTQPATPVLISHELTLRQLTGEASFTREGSKYPLLNEAGNLTAGAKTFTTIVKHPKKTAAQWKIRLVSVDGSTLESAVFNNTSPDLDTTAPNNGTPITITHAAIKNGRNLIVRFNMPTLQMASHDHNSLIIHDNNVTGTGRKFYDPNSQTWVATYSDGTTEINLGKGSVPAMNTPYSTLIAGGRSTIYIRIGVYNQFNGSSVTYSGDLTAPILLSSAGQEPVNSDLGVPSSLGTPVLSWTATGKLEISNLTVGANFNTLLDKYVVVRDAFGHYYDFTTNTLAANEAAARLKIGLVKRYTFAHAKLKKIRAAFEGAGVVVPYNLFGYFYAENANGPSLASSDSAALLITSQADVLGNYDAVNVIDIGTGLVTPIQQALNGDMLYQDGAGNVNGWTKGTAVAAGNSPIAITTTDNIYWDKDNHRLIWRGNGSALLQNFKRRVQKDDYYAVSFLAATAGVFGTGTILIQFVNNNDESTSTQLTATINLSDLTTSYQLFGAIIQLDHTSNYVTPFKFLKFSTTAVLTATNNVIIDKIMVVRGKQPAAFSPRIAQYEGDGTAPGNTENINLTTINTVALPDLGNPSGSQGGGRDPGTGGRLIPSTL